MVRTKRKRSEYNDLLTNSSQLFQIGEKKVNLMVNEFTEKIEEIVSKRPKPIDSLKALNRSGFDVSKAAEDFMNMTFSGETDGYGNDSMMFDEEDEKIPEITPAPKRRKKSDPYKVPGVNMECPADIFNRTLMTQKKSFVQEEEDDVSAI